VTGRVVQPVIGSPPALKVTVPPPGGVVAGAVGLTVAVKVTLSVQLLGESLEVTTVVVAAWLTTCVMPVEVLPLN